jgi:tetratricopeptide (TPR) repeat protein
VPTVGEAFEQARQLTAAGQLGEAEVIYRRLVELLPQAPDVWGSLGIFYLDAGRPDAAIAPLEKATELAPTHGPYFGALGASYRALNRHEDSVRAFGRALEIGPAAPELYGNLALAQVKAGHAAEGLANFDRALAMRGDYQTGHFNRAMALLSMNRPAEAAAGFERAVQLAPLDAGAHCGLGMAYFELARFDEALAAYGRALALNPRYHEVRRNQALVWFARREYHKAWPAFESRIECEDYAKRSFTEPRWDGSPLAGQTILLHAEQGLGDTLHFVRYLPLAAKAAKRVWFDPPASLRPLLVQSGFDEYLVPEGELPPFDVHAPLLSLGGHLPDDRGEPFWPGRYLRADSQLVAQWRERLGMLAGLKVGIAWAGNAAYGYDHYRSTRLANFAPLASIPGVNWISLQLGAGREQIGEVADRMRVIDLGPDFDTRGGAFMDAAAVIEQLDLVISVDTAIGHLAAALGKPVWLALAFVADWRWGATGESSAWYPATRLFRQQSFNDWTPVFAQMAEALRPLAEARSGQGA